MSLPFSHYKAQIPPSAAETAAEAYKQVFTINRMFSPHADVAFQQLEQLGAGGAGVVYKVRDLRFDREAALKVLIDNSDKRAVKRFLREVSITARLEHPCIPPVYESGQGSNGCFYMLMKRVDGETLKKRIRAVHEAPNPAKTEIEELLRILIKVGEAIGYAHSKGILHRDLKPENIMVGAFGEVFVMDWGIARDMSESADSWLAYGEEQTWRAELSNAGRTQVGTILGTPGYMSPEQAEGIAADEQSDVFALGVILCEMLTGVSPIEGASPVAKVMATFEGQIRSPRSIKPAVSKEVNSIACKALSFEISKRTSSASHFVSDLKSFLAGETVVAHEYSVFSTLLRVINRHPTLILLSIMILALFTTGLVLVAEIQRSKANRERGLRVSAEKEAQLKIAEKEKAAAEGAARTAKTIISSFTQARYSARRGRPKATVMKLLDDGLQAAKHSYEALLSAASICEDGGLDDQQRQFLLEAESAFPPAWEALFARHRLEFRQHVDEPKYFTDAMDKLSEMSAKYVVENEYTLFVRSLRLEKEGKVEEAIEALQAIEKYSIAFPEALNNLGRFYTNQQKWDQALDCYERALKLAPKMLYVYYNRARLHGLRNMPKKAIADCNRALDIQPSHGMTLKSRGRFKLLLGESQGAKNDFERALESTPKDAYLYFLIGLADLELDRLRDALNAFNNALAIDSKNVSALWKRAQVYQTLGRNDDAEKDYSKALTIDPDFVPAIVDRALILYKKNDYWGAIIEGNRALKIEAGNVKALYCRGVSYLKLFKHSKALRDFEAILVIQKRDPIAFSDRGLAYQGLGDLEKAMADFNTSYEIDPKGVSNLLNRAALNYELKRYVKVVEDCETGIKIDPRAYKIFLQLAMAQCRQQLFERALKNCRRAKKLSPNDPIVLYNYTCILSLRAAGLSKTDLQAQRDLELAAASLSKAIEFGFSSWDGILNDTDLKSLRESKFFKEVEALRGK
jgi:tetratricopeptide (TPR) repeat protein/serine/threonine protein kinase